MRKIPPAYGRLLGAYFVAGLLLWTTPLLSILHAESSAVIATVAFFGSGLSTRSLQRSGFRLSRILFMQEAALVVPLVLLTTTLLWQPNCGYLQGLFFYFAFPAVTVVFSTGLMALLVEAGEPRSRTIFVTVGVLAATIPPIYDIGFHPQFYTYNHVFGGFLGPIYDDQLAIRPGLFAFRVLTLLWAIFFFLLRGTVKRTMQALPVVMTGILIGICYALGSQLGFITTHRSIQDELGSVRRTEHFDIYYDASVIPEAALSELEAEHEFRYQELSNILRETVDRRIQSYIYPDPDTKARLTGARYTNVAPVWLSQPQTHVLYSAFERVFPHELVHVFSREFGLPLIRASASVGLVEGLAVALEPPDGAPGPHEQVSAALFSARGGTRQALSRSEDLTESLVSRLSPLGFWTGRGAVSYTAMGSFAAYLLQAYGPEPLKKAYPWAGFDSAYGKSAEELANEWRAAILNIDAVASSSEYVVSARFQIPSLFEKVCPHYIPLYRRRYNEATTALVRRDSVRAMALLEESLRHQPGFAPAIELWAGIEIAMGEATDVLARLDAEHQDSLSALLLVRRGDAQALLGRYREAALSYDLALNRLPQHAHETRSLVLLRRAASSHPTSLHAFLVEGIRYESPDTSSAPAVGLALAALRDARAGRFEQALASIRTTSPEELAEAVPYLGGELRRRRLAWLARFALRSGFLADAAAYADSAARAYRGVGAFNEAAVQLDLVNKIGWLAGEEMKNIAQASFADTARDIKITAPGIRKKE